MNENNRPDQGAKPADEEQILDLTEQVADAPEDAENITDIEDDSLAATVELEDDFDDDLDNDADDDDFVESMGMEIGSEDSEYEDDEDSAAFYDGADEHADGIDVSSEQLDAALERVIKTMFYDKIDRVLAEVIEKTVTKEIERLKQTLLEEASGAEK